MLENNTKNEIVQNLGPQIGSKIVHFPKMEHFTLVEHFFQKKKVPLFFHPRGGGAERN